MGIYSQTGILTNFKCFSALPLLLKYFNVSIYLSNISDSLTSVFFILTSLIYLSQLYLRFNQSYYFSKFLSDIEVIGLVLVSYNYVLAVLIDLFNFSLTNGDLLLAIGMNFLLAALVYQFK